MLVVEELEKEIELLRETKDIRKVWVLLFVCNVKVGICSFSE